MTDNLQTYLETRQNKLKLVQAKIKNTQKNLKKSWLT